MFITEVQAADSTVGVNEGSAAGAPPGHSRFDIYVSKRTWARGRIGRGERGPERMESSGGMRKARGAERQWR